MKGEASYGRYEKQEPFPTIIYVLIRMCVRDGPFLGDIKCFKTFCRRKSNRNSKKSEAYSRQGIDVYIQLERFRYRRCI